jgi:hypothetical protein
MLAWMRSFGELQRIGIESTGSYGAGLLRFMQQAKIMVLKVATPDKQDRHRRGKNDDLDAMIAAIVDELAPNLVAVIQSAIPALPSLLTAGDNPERLRSEASFASLCGASSSGVVGKDRQAPAQS